MRSFTFSDAAETQKHAKLPAKEQKKCMQAVEGGLVQITSSSHFREATGCCNAEVDYLTGSQMVKADMIQMNFNR